MKIINTTWTGNSKQVVAFRLPITVWQEEQMEVPVVDKTKRPSATEQRRRRLAFIPRWAHLKFFRSEAKVNQLKNKDLCG
jgi:hypothetical protein